VSDDRLDSLDYYTLLGVAEDATIDQVKSSFRNFARKYHPDRFCDADEDKRLRATRIFRRGSEAFQTLTDPQQRKAYDNALAHGQLRLTDDGRIPEQRVSSPEPVKQVAPPPKTSPENPIRSEQAQAYFKRAVDAAKSQDWVTAWKALRAAMQVEPGNAFLETRFKQVDAMVRKNG
jgi:hypothetical protein